MGAEAILSSRALQTELLRLLGAEALWAALPELNWLLGCMV